MNIIKFLMRKYPKHYNELVMRYELDYLNLLKSNKYKIGFLKEDNGENKKGDIVIYHHTKEYEEIRDSYDNYLSGEFKWTGNFEYFYYFQKPHNMHHPSSYLKLVDDIKN